jgi:transcriptional regulator with PAS, ATPase and Fis domain
LRNEVTEGRFRHDLYYRLCVVDVRIPPLRERLADLQVLAHEFLERSAARAQRAITGFAPDAWEALLRHRWPGNVRELEHAIERACAVAQGCRIEMRDLPGLLQRQTSETEADVARALRDIAREYQREYLIEVLTRHRGHRLKAAQALGISLSTLKRRLRSGRSSSQRFDRSPSEP